MRQLASLVISFLLLLAAVPSVSATPLSYTISALGSWTFSGIQVDIGTQGGGTSIENVCAPGGPCEGSPGLPGMGFIANSYGISLDDGHVFTTASLIAPGLAVINAPLLLGITARELGWSTVTFNYQFQESGIVPVGGLLTASASVYAFGFGLNHLQQIETTLPADQSLNITRTITGSFTGSLFCGTIGFCSTFTATAFSSVQYVVPGPDTFWLSLAGLVSLAVWMRGRTAVS